MMTTDRKIHVTPEATWATRAIDLMTPNPASIREDASLWDAVRFLTDRGFNAAPVINEAGRPVGVLSRADILIHERESAEAARGGGAAVADGELTAGLSATLVRDVMSPFVLVVDPDLTADAVARQLVAFRVHRLFVVDPNGVLVGVISALDLLRHLQPHAGDATSGRPTGVDDE